MTVAKSPPPRGTKRSFPFDFLQNKSILRQNLMKYAVINFILRSTKHENMSGIVILEF